MAIGNVTGWLGLALVKLVDLDIGATTSRKALSGGLVVAMVGCSVDTQAAEAATVPWQHSHPTAATSS